MTSHQAPHLIRKVRPVRLRVVGRAALAATLFCLAACAALSSALDRASVELPMVTLDEVRLVDMPSRTAWSAYLCPHALADRLGGEAGARFACDGLFGPAPTAEAMRLSFEMRLSVDNPNQVPVPLSAVQTTLTVLPGSAGKSRLGTACAALCGPADKSCAQTAARECPKDAVDVTNAAHAGAAVSRLLIAKGARLASGETVELRSPEVLAAGRAELVVHYAVDPLELLPVLSELAEESASQLADGQAVSLDIPYALEGTVFSEGGSLGALAVPFGPLKGTWKPKSDELLGRAERRASVRKSASSGRDSSR